MAAPALSSPLHQKPFELAEAPTSSLRRQKVLVSPASLYIIELHWFTAGSRQPPQSGLWMPRRPHPAQAWATPQKSSKTAATVLCPKMKVPTSTDTTPHTSKQHLPSQQIYVTFLEFCTDKPSTHRKHYLKPSSVINIGKIQSILRDLIGFRSGRIKYPRQF